MPKPPPPPPQFNLSVGFLVGLIGLFLAIGLLFASVYQVEQESEAVVLRFGKFSHIAGPGLHFKLPLVDEKVIVPVERQKKLEFGFATPNATDPYQSADNPKDMKNEQNMVTGDLNASLVRWVVQYRIDDPQRFLFNVRDPENTLRDAAESVMREVVGDRTVDELITIGRAEIQDENLKRLQSLVSSYEMGIKIEQIQLKNVDVPEPVQPSFDEVNSAQKRKSTRIEQAEKERESIIPQAKGEAEKMISEAQAYKTQRVNEAEGDAAKFNSVFEEYQKAPQVTKRRIYLETLAEVVPNLGNKVIIDEETSQLLPLLQLQNQSQAK